MPKPKQTGPNGYGDGATRIGLGAVYLNLGGHSNLPKACYGRHGERDCRRRGPRRQKYRGDLRKPTFHRHEEDDTRCSKTGMNIVEWSGHKSMRKTYQIIYGRTFGPI